MQRLFNIDKWFVLEAGKVMNFANPAARRVRLDVNSAGPATVFYVTGDGETTLLAQVNGRDVIEFASHGGDFALTVEGNDVWMYTIDGEDVSYSNPGAVVFAKIVERRARNPELELMQHMMNRNLELRLKAQQDELVRLWDRREAARAALAAKPAAASPAPGPGSEPKQDGVPGDVGGGEPADGGVGGGSKKKD